MARTVTAVASPKPGLGVAAEVSEETREELEGIFKHLTEHPEQEGLTTFATDLEDGSEPGAIEADIKKQVASWLREARTWAITREAGALRFRQLPSKHLPTGTVRFQITKDLPANAARTEAN
jgi:hypothetical protein